MTRDMGSRGPWSREARRRRLMRAATRALTVRVP
eukprot:COSAG05_NODE_26676_length_184_cov_44.564706_1_plen_33_part_01